jgi:hypothetical protein
MTLLVMISSFISKKSKFMKLSKPLCAIAASALVVSGCAKSSSSVAGAYQSPSLYANWSCEQLAAEEGEVRRRVVVLAQKQDNAATRDAVAMGVGLVLFWPVLFVLAAGDEEAQLSILKGQHDALVSAQTGRQCTAQPTAAQAPMSNTPASGMPVTAASANGIYRPAVAGPRPVEGTLLSSFSNDQMQTYCGQTWEIRQASDGRTEFNPCHRKDEFL